MAKKLTARQKLHKAAEPEVVRLEGDQAARMRANTLLIPTPLQIDAAIRQIPAGSTKQVEELRCELAHQFGADNTCPLCTGIFWRIAAEAAEEDREAGVEPITPYWRLTKAGKPNPKLPGGIERHRVLLAAEGVKI